jgi:hypothetical protein
MTNVTEAELGINGAARSPIPVEQISKDLLRVKDGEASLTLRNSSQVNATPVSTDYKISLRIATPRAMRNVEQAFSERIAAANLSRASIDGFLNDRRCSGVGRDYADGLAKYALGILLKERPSTERLTTPFSRYRENYGSALHILSDIPRPFAYLIAEIVRFALNDFSNAEKPTGYAELDLARTLLASPDSERQKAGLEVTSKRRELCPIDHGTGKVLDLAIRMSQQERWSPILDEECRSAAASHLLDETDTQKGLAIWAAMAWRLGARDSAIEPLRRISAIYPFRTWAEPYLESATK